MCVHPINGHDNLDRPIEISKYQHELDNCDYFDLTDPIEASHGDLLVMQLNIRGLFGKLSNLKDLVNRVSRGKKIDIMLLCETWQNKNSPTISIPGYSYVYKSRKHKWSRYIHKWKNMIYRSQVKWQLWMHRICGNKYHNKE